MIQVAPDHHPHQFPGSDFGGRDRPDLVPVLEYRNAFGEFEDLLEAVGDVDDGEAPLAQGADPPEEHLGLCGGQRGRRLVQDEHARVEGERLRYLHGLLLGYGEVPNEGTGPDRVVYLEGPQKLCGFPFHAPAVHQRAAVRLAPEKDVLGDGPFGQQVELLVDDGDALLLRLAGVPEAYRLPVEQYLPRVRRVGPGEHLHQRGLAGPVLPDDRVDLTGPALQIHPVEHPHADEALLDAPHLQQRRALVLAQAPTSRTPSAAITLAPTTPASSPSSLSTMGRLRVASGRDRW